MSKPKTQSALPTPKKSIAVDEDVYADLFDLRSAKRPHVKDVVREAVAALKREEKRKK